MRFPLVTNSNFVLPDRVPGPAPTGISWDTSASVTGSGCCDVVVNYGGRDTTLLQETTEVIGVAVPDMAPLIERDATSVKRCGAS